jgi:hypothetical protein
LDRWTEIALSGHVLDAAQKLINFLNDNLTILLYNGAASTIRRTWGRGSSVCSRGFSKPKVIARYSRGNLYYLEMQPVSATYILGEIRVCAEFIQVGEGKDEDNT